MIRGLKYAAVATAMAVMLLTAVFSRDDGESSTWRLFSVSYNRAWNAMVRVIVQDNGYAVRAADPKLGYLGTWPKSVKKLDGPKTRVSINANVKKAADGTLVTLACLIEEYMPVKGTDKGRWIVVPSDNKCEAGLIEQMAKKLAEVK